MTKEMFRDDLRKSVNAIYNACGIKPKGFRAPAFTVVQSTLWALDVLKEENMDYDSSIYPTSVHPDYGIGDAPLSIFQVKENIPCSGGAYLRFLPYPLYRKLVDNVVSSGRNFIFYLHPWEIDAAMPRLKLPLSKYIRHYTNLSSTYKKMEQLLQDFEFTTLEHVLQLDRVGQLQSDLILEDATE
jgi:hypothetical protein